MQHIQYVPFGEVFVEERNAKWSTPYKFNGKEQDEETGLCYYGARYYDPRTSVWLSVDPLAEKYPNMSSYVYCANNPVKYVDPDGRDWAEVTTGEGKDLKTTIKWFDSKQAFVKSGEKGKYLGEAVVVFNGSKDEKLGKDGKMNGKGAKPAKATIYGINGKDDIKTYDAMTMTSNTDEYTPIEGGDYKAFYQDMSSSPYGSKGGSLTYRISKLDGNLTLSTIDGELNKDENSKQNYNTTKKSEIFFHRTNNDGKATHSSSGCMIIDGRHWNKVEKQLGKSMNIYIRIQRK